MTTPAIVGHTEPTAATGHSGADNSERVRAFAQRMLEARSIALISDLIIDIALSGAWRDYDIDGVPFRWRAAEFDYFLITCGVVYVDVKEVLKGRDTAPLVPLFDQKSPEHRPLRVASDALGFLPDGKTLETLAHELGWYTDRGRARKPPLGRRSRARASGGSREARSREARRMRIGAERCAVLVQLVAWLAREELSPDECRFVADELNMAAGHSDGGFAK
jgi:hypothetical protein